MTTEPDMAQRNIGWLAQQLRATIFHSPVDLGGAVHEYWARAFGSVPQQDETRNLEGVRVVGGQVGDTKWAMNIRPERTDILAHPNSAPPPGSNDVWKETEEPYEQTLRKLINSGQLLLDMVPGIGRLAVGGIVIMPGPALPEAYAKLGVMLPELDFGSFNTPDFSFQVNRRRRSQIPPVQWINRLATWSIAQGQTVSFGSVGDNLPITSESGIQFAASLQLDINTAPIDAGGSIPTHRAQDILVELAEMALEITRKGDIA